LVLDRKTNHPGFVIYVLLVRVYVTPINGLNVYGKLFYMLKCVRKFELKRCKKRANSLVFLSGR